MLKMTELITNIYRENVFYVMNTMRHRKEYIIYEQLLRNYIASHRRGSLLFINTQHELCQKLINVEGQDSETGRTEANNNNKQVLTAADMGQK
jgi:hypothetical protein